MANVELSRSEEWELENDSQDVRGWDVVDGSGQRLGTVRELIIDTERERVSSLVLDSGQQVSAREVTLGDGVVCIESSASLGSSGSSTQSTSSQSTSSTSGTASRARSSESDSLNVGSGSLRTGSEELRSGEERRLPIIEEELRIGKRRVETGGVRVDTRVEERPVEEEVRLREERVSVERNPTNRPVSDADIDALDGGTIEVTESAEEAVVDKQARVVEEVVVRKDVEEHTETVRDSVRRTDVDVENLESRGTTSSMPPSNIQDPSRGGTGRVDSGRPDPTLREPGSLSPSEEELRRRSQGGQNLKGPGSGSDSTGRL